MLLKFAAYFSIICGIVWFFKPEMLRGWFLSKIGSNLFWLAMGIFFLPLFHFGIKFGLLGVFGLIVLVWLGRGVIRETLKKGLGNVPLTALQAIGLLSVISGVVLLWRR